MPDRTCFVPDKYRFESGEPEYATLILPRPDQGWTVPEHSLLASDKTC